MAKPTAPDQPSVGKIKPPKGTRDAYPDDLLRRRYITELWRAVSVRHGFEEIDGPTFESSDLYAVKSGEGILGELFQAYSGKDPREVAEVQSTGRAPFALRPEFTPTLARMYAAKATTLPQPTRWFCVQNFFRAERPQRGRLREFFQWNCDVIGGEEGENLRGHEADTIAVAIDCFAQAGLTPDTVRASVWSRDVIGKDLGQHGLSPTDDLLQRVYRVLDERPKITPEAYVEQAHALGLPRELIEKYHPVRRAVWRFDAQAPSDTDYAALAQRQGVSEAEMRRRVSENMGAGLFGHVQSRDIAPWCQADSMIIRGLAYYTGTVFEVIAEGERAVAGGGRYDNLIELFGGPATPAVGFGMGDVVLGNLLDDHTLMPAPGRELMDAVQRLCCSYSLRPDAFVVPGGDDEAEALVQPLLARLRRGTESQAWLSRDDRKPWHADRYDRDAGGIHPLHARTTSKATRNLKKLLQDAERQHARFCVVIHAADKVQLKDLDTREDLAHPTKGDFSITPGAENDVSAELVRRLGR